MPLPMLIIGLLLVLLAAIALLAVRASPSSQLGRLRQRFFPSPTPSAHTGATIIESNGEEYPLPDTPNRTTRLSERIAAIGNRRQLPLVAVVVLIALVAGWQIYRLTTTPTPEQFIVLVAPFREPGGVVGQAGREAATTLVANLPGSSGQRVVARAIADVPADTNTALALLRREGADALIVGDITAGGMIERETLQPTLVYQPDGPAAPRSWAGYAGRFAMPTEYKLASNPLNGAVVLPSLLGALADYNAGRLDAAYTTLTQLTTNYPALVPTLPRALRGNILWARGEYQQAINEYQAALVSAAQTPTAGQVALLANNLGAIQQDAGDAGASASFNQAIQALQGNDLSALRYNLALQNLRDGKASDAITGLEVARSPNLIGDTPPPIPLLLSLSEAYLQNGDFNQANAFLATAERQVSTDAALVTAETRNSVRARLQADIEIQRSILELAQEANARGPLLWELLGNDALSMSQLDSVRKALAQTVDDTSVVSQLWTRLATTKDAAGDLMAGQVATFQAQQAQNQLRARQRWLAWVELERGSLQGTRRTGGLASIWTSLVGDRSPAGQGRAIIDDLLKSQPSDVETLILLGNSQLLNNQPDEALTQFAKAAALAPTRPEPVYGQALAWLAKNERDTAKQLFNQAIANNQAFFPARQRLARLAEEDADWETVVAQRRWLDDNRSSDANTLALADALRHTGPAGTTQSEELLLKLANNNNTTAMIALGNLYQQNGDAEGARHALERAQQVAPRDANIAYEYGQLLEKQQNLDAALVAYTHAIELDAANIPARLALGALYAQRKQNDEAGTQYAAALQAGAKDPLALQQIGDVLLMNGEYDTAATAYQRAIDARVNSSIPANDTTDPNTALAIVYHGLGQANLKRSQLDAAQAAEQRALELNPNYGAALVGLGDIALENGKPDDASGRYNAVLQLPNLAVPERVAANIGLGRAAGAQQEWSVAQAYFSTALGLDNGSPAAHLWLGEALVRQTPPNIPAAITEYVAALKLRENRYPEAYFGLAQAQIASGRPDLAKANIGYALQLKANYPEALILQGKLYEQLGDTNAALGSYGQAIGTKTKLAEPYYRRGMIYVRANELDKAASDLESAIKLQANFSEAAYWLGRVYLAQGKLKPARDQFAAAVKSRDGNFADARFYQGLAEEQLGQRTEAIQSYETALEQNASGEWAGEARSALARLRQS